MRTLSTSVKICKCKKMTCVTKMIISHLVIGIFTKNFTESKTDQYNKFYIAITGNKARIGFAKGYTEYLMKIPLDPSSVRSSGLERDREGSSGINLVQLVKFFPRRFLSFFSSIARLPPLSSKFGYIELPSSLM